MRKIFTIISVLAVSCILFTGCGKYGNNTSTSDTQSTTENGTLASSGIGGGDTNGDGVVGDVVSDAGDVVDDIVTSAESIVSDMTGNGINS